VVLRLDHIPLATAAADASPVAAKNSRIARPLSGVPDNESRSPSLVPTLLLSQ
jgi:hypothetical protein